jgi:hypothetical protein
MLSRAHCDAKATTRAEGVSVIVWLAMMVGAVLVLWLTLSAISFEGLDRLLPDGEPFEPIYTT